MYVQMFFTKFAANCEMRTFSSVENCWRMQGLACAVEHFSLVGSRSTTRTDPLKSGLSVRNQAVEAPMMAPPTMITS